MEWRIMIFIRTIWAINLEEIHWREKKMIWKNSNRMRKKGKFFLGKFGRKNMEKCKDFISDAIDFWSPFTSTPQILCFLWSKSWLDARIPVFCWYIETNSTISPQSIWIFQAVIQFWDVEDFRRKLFGEAFTNIVIFVTYVCITHKIFKLTLQKQLGPLEIRS